jgi:hypothetical protein
VLAATGLSEKAHAEMEALRRQFPTYPFRARAELRMALVQHAHRGDFEGAARLCVPSSRHRCPVLPTP